MTPKTLHPAAALAATLALAAPAAAGPQWTAESIVQVESGSDFAAAPDGRSVVWVRATMSAEKGGRVSNVVLTRFAGDGHREIELTRGTDSNRSPRWSPDGRHVAFLSDHDLPEKLQKKAEGAQVWVIPAEGGAARPLTAWPRGVSDVRWIDDDTLGFLAQETPSSFERDREEKKDTTSVVDDAEREPRVRVFRVPLEAEPGRGVQRLTTNDDWIQRFAVSPDGRWLAAVHGRSLRFEYDNEITPELRLLEIATGRVTTIAADRRWLPGRLAWARDSSGLYVTSEYSSDPRYFNATVTRLELYDVAAGRLAEVDLDWSRGLAGEPVPTPDGFLALLADGARFRTARYVRAGSGWTRSELTGTHGGRIFDWTVSPDGATLFYEYSTASRPTQWYRASLEGGALGGEEVFTDLNAAWKDKPIGRAEVVRWTGARGDTVEGILHYPTDYREGEARPLILMIHGGPTSFDMDRWSLGWSRPIQPLLERGAFVFRPNYHGSGNYGLEWAESICCGRYYELERVDIENGVDSLIERGLADPDRLATMGWSNGAILTTELITRSHRYKAASAGAGDVEWISDWANVDFGAAFDNYYFGKPPYEDPAFYVEKSPYFRLKDVTTPTLIATGTADRNVPPSQSWSHFRVMQQATDTPVKLLLFPGEPHGLRKYGHQLRKVEEELAWMDRYLFETTGGASEAVRPGSRLQAALTLAASARVDGDRGVAVQGRLTPEVVAFRGLEVGRFEVTRAQYAAYDEDYAVAPGTGNYPATGVSAEDARAYLGWLSDLTGRIHRLPNADEAKRLYEGSAAGENTLDHWAGYAPNLEDARKLREAAAGIGGDAPLLRPVGSFPASLEGEPVFDLNGNAAEWCVGAAGEPRPCGGSADQPADPLNREPPAPAYRGFRVVRDAAE